MRLISCFAGCFGIVALVGCSSSLQPAGQGGSGGGTGGLGGTSGSSGTSGACADLAAQYRQAVIAARACTVGAPDACTALVHASVGGDPCACDFIYVNDPTQPDAVYQMAVSLGCQQVSLCGGASCQPPPPSNDRCAPIDGGAGLCYAALPGPG